MTDRPTASSAGAPVRAIAYYLPQFHPIPENDAWWGRGFTEWTSVTRAKPLFEGHYQPHLPTELGFYDLRLPEVRAAQAELAREHGIHGFCYYYYSFGTKRLLERPLLDMLESGNPDFPFCICWANESWSRRWDGSEAQVLIAQDDSPERYRQFIHEVLPILKDRRYIQVGGAPMLLVYRVGRMPDAAAVAAYWREQAEAAGLPGLYLCAVQSHDATFDPRRAGFDAAVEFPPSPWHGRKIDPRTLPGLDPDFTGTVFDYEDFVTHSLARSAPDYRLLRGVMMGWDNTARRGPASFLFHGATPRGYEAWLRGAVAWTAAHNPPDERVVFLNAWNEWAEGTHLEPDERHGRAWLEATQRALSRAEAWRGALEALRREGTIPPEVLRAHVEDLQHALERLERVESVSTASRGSFTEGVAPAFASKPLHLGGLTQLEFVQGRPPGGRIKLRDREPLKVSGWAVAPGLDLRGAPAFLVLRSPTGERIYSAPLGERTVRHDVAFQLRQLDPRSVCLAGFDVELATDALAPGEYKLGVVHASDKAAVAGFSEHRISVE
ncbi:glycosyltransferase WbsX family protein [Anaeromyxobacter diazotrophicus]|uniref:Uncharacterized protein n=1 Tax=Anaeromyxobacter diazotrophicus TaxID=2590199 RepID=A0A7I9VNF3_9BACT|nr:glycoside hydrolase family 99-like domain-containing protein [Anaeromyxobacter diazotrophicus]GEJ57945.1 hypothetical protein AMYX_26860 [Anaeromyxobacter diazotrophicus]